MSSSKKDNLVFNIRSGIGPLVSSVPATPLTSYYWVGDAANQLWNDADNWSDTSGGTGGFGIPNDANSKAIWDTNSTNGPILLNATITIGDFDSTAGNNNDDVINLNTNSLTVTNSGAGNGDFLMKIDGTVDGTNGQILTHQSGSALTIWRNLSTARTISTSAVDAMSLSMKGTGTLRYFTVTSTPNVIFSVNDFFVADSGHTTTLRPQASAIGLDINVANQMHFGGGTVAFDETESSTFLSIEITQQAAELDVTGTGTLTGIINFEHEGQNSILMTLFNTDDIALTMPSGRGAVFDITGGNSTIRDWKCTGDLNVGSDTIFSMEKVAGLDVNGFTLTCKQMRVGTVNNAQLTLNGGIVSCTEWLRLDGGAGTTIDVNSGGYITATNSDGRTNGGTYTGDTGGYIEFTGAAPSAGTTYYFADAGDDTTGDGTIGNPWKTFSKAVAELGAGISCLFNRGDTFTITNGQTTGMSSGTIGAYGTGNRPLFTLGDDETIRINGGWDWYNAKIQFGTPA